MLILGASFLIFGHLNIYNEQTLAEITDEYLGDAVVTTDKKTVTFTFSAPELTELRVSKEGLAGGEDLTDGMTVHILADLEYVVAHEEKRTIISGRLKESKDEEFYRITQIKWRPLTESNIGNFSG